MTIEEKVREIMLSEALSDSEKLGRLRALIPLEVFEIDNLNQATNCRQRTAAGWGSMVSQYAQ
jgi:hypothetical protein